MSVHHWGEDPSGIWYLSILDVPEKPNQGKKGLLRKWSLELHGTEKNPQLNWTSPCMTHTIPITHTMTHPF